MDAHYVRRLDFDMKERSLIGVYVLMQIMQSSHLNFWALKGRLSQAGWFPKNLSWASLSGLERFKATRIGEDLRKSRVIHGIKMAPRTPLLDDLLP